MRKQKFTGDSDSSMLSKLQGYLDFLVSILQIIPDDDSDLQRVYSLLQENLNKLDDTFIKILRYWATTT
jgi:hypothetical protein